MFSQWFFNFTLKLPNLHFGKKFSKNLVGHNFKSLIHFKKKEINPHIAVLDKGTCLLNWTNKGEPFIKLPSGSILKCLCYVVCLNHTSGGKPKKTQKTKSDWQFVRCQKWFPFSFSIFVFPFFLMLLSWSYF